MAKKDGGQAFPEIFANRDQYGNYDVYSYGGMKVRDYLAGQALTGMLTNNEGFTLPEGKTVFNLVAESAYKYADAMIEVREKQENENPANC